MNESHIFREVPMSNGKTVQVSINRRGCTGEWTKESDEALAAIVRAVYENPEAYGASSPAPTQEPRYALQHVPCHHPAGFNAAHLCFDCGSPAPETEKPR